MGRKSLRKTKNTCQRCREAAGLTRREASNRLGFISENRLEKIESGKTAVQPAEILAMEEAYGALQLANHYCRRHCAIGAKTILPLEQKTLPEIAVQLLYLNEKLEGLKAGLVECAACSSKESTLDNQQMQLLEDLAGLLHQAGSAAGSLDLLIGKEKKKEQGEKEQ